MSIALQQELPQPEPQQLVTAEEFAALPGGDERYELVNGVIVEMPRPKPRHGLTAGRLSRKLALFLDQQPLGEIFIESGFLVGREPDIIRGPDLAFVSAHRVPSGQDLDSYFEGAPDIAIEIVSPNDATVDTRQRIDEYLAAGARLIWIIFPMFKTIEVHHLDLTATTLRTTDTLDGGDVLPGFSVPVSALFE